MLRTLKAFNPALFIIHDLWIFQVLPRVPLPFQKHHGFDVHQNDNWRHLLRRAVRHLVPRLGFDIGEGFVNVYEIRDLCYTEQIDGNLFIKSIIILLCYIKQFT